MRQYSVVLLDDEELILKSLQSLIDWEGLGCCVAGTAKSGAKGKQLIQRLRPDIVITDIKMPEITGIELAAYCARHLPRTRVIILSAYADFSFAQSALQSRTVAYLLKPIDKKELTDAVKRAADECRQMESSLASREQERADMENTRTLATASLLFHLARYGVSGLGGTDAAWVREKAKIDSVVIMGAFFNTSLAVAPALARGRAYTENALREAGYAPIFGSADDKITLLCPIIKGIDHTTARGRLIATLREMLRGAPPELGVCVFCVSAVYKDEETLHRCYQDGLHMLRCGFFKTDSCVITRMEENNIEPYSLNTQELVSALRHGQTEKAEQLLNEGKRVLARIGDRQLAAAKLREWSREAALCAAKLGMDTGRLWVHALENENFDARYESMRRGVMAVCDYAKRKCGVVSRMCLYVEEHYGDRALSLESVADEMGLNSSYLSRVFKKERGENFSEYLIRVRIARAQELLGGTELKTYAIAAEVGFGDAHYFSQVFKKKCGMTPAEYRQNAKK